MTHPSTSFPVLSAADNWVVPMAQKAYGVYRITVEKTCCLPDGNLREWDLLDFSDQAGWIAATAAIAYACLQKDGVEAVVASVIEQGKEEFEKIIAG